MTINCKGFADVLYKYYNSLNEEEKTEADQILFYTYLKYKKENPTTLNNSSTSYFKDFKNKDSNIENSEELLDLQEKGTVSKFLQKLSSLSSTKK